jgi:hypothetical protein
MQKIFVDVQNAANEKYIFTDSTYVRPALKADFTANGSPATFKGQQPLGSK